MHIVILFAILLITPGIGMIITVLELAPDISWPLAAVMLGFVFAYFSLLACVSVPSWREAIGRGLDRLSATLPGGARITLGDQERREREAGEPRAAD